MSLVLLLVYLLYGLPKIHKRDFSSKFQFRIIFSAINTPCYKLARYLVPLLSELSINLFTEENSYSFVKIFNSLVTNGDFFMISFHVKDLFTNVPLSETINIVLIFLFPNPTSTFQSFSRKCFQDFLNLGVSNSFFLFNG